MEEVELACSIARRDFGAVVGTVLEILLLHPGLKLVEICSHAANSLVTAKSVRHALAVLLNHGLIYAEAQSGSLRDRRQEERQLTTSSASTTGNEAENKRSQSRRSKRPRSSDDFPNALLIYKVEIGAVLLRLRNPRYAHLAQLMYGEHGERIARLLLTRGRLTAAQIIRAEYIALNATEEQIKSAENTLIVMAKSGFLLWAGSTADGPLSGGTVRVVGPDLSPSKDVGNDSDGEAEHDADELTLSIQNDTSQFTEEELDPCKPTYHVSSGSISIGEGINCRVRNAPLRTNRSDAWMVSTWFLNRIFHSHCCASVVGALMTQRSDPISMIALKLYRSGLNVAARTELPGSDTNWTSTKPIEFSAIKKELVRNGLVLDDEQFERAVHALLEVRPVAVVAVPEHMPSALIFEIGTMISLARQQTVEDTLAQMHSRTGLRVWRALALHGCMQEKMIAEKTMLPVKTVREYLYRLHTDGFLTMQEIPKSNEPARPDRPSVMWYLWRAEFATAVDKILQDSIRATRRVLLKSVEMGSDDSQVPAKKQNALKLLEATLCRCDILVILLRDFGPVDPNCFKPMYPRR